MFVFSSKPYGTKHMFPLLGYEHPRLGLWLNSFGTNTQLNELIFLTKSSNVSDELSHALLSGIHLA